MLNVIRPESITINDMTFRPIEGVTYKYDYIGQCTEAKGKGADYEKALLRYFILNDLWFVLYFVMKKENLDIGLTTNHPFPIKICRMIEDGPATDTLDVWARGHLKSNIITVAETLQFQLRHPERCSCIMAYARPLAKSFLRSIKLLVEESTFLKTLFPDVLWGNPGKDAPKWSEDEGLIFKRKNPMRFESSLEAWGLIEGMPTGRHFERLVFDDLETEDIRNSPDMLNQVFSKFEMAVDNLGMIGAKTQTRIIGTYYSHLGPVKRITDKKGVDGKKLYSTRLIPATADGTPNGRPVWESQESLDKSKAGQHFNSQKLCDPTPKGTQKLDSSLLKVISPEMIPVDVFKFMLIDQAGDQPSNAAATRDDSWAILVVAVETKSDGVGASNVYITDLWISPAGEGEAIEQATRMYMNGGMIMQVGVEKASMSTTHLHVQNALRVKNRHISEESGSLVLLRPAGRNKVKMIESALVWPLNNGKLHISSLIGNAHKQRLIEEMDWFPFGKDDGLNALAYFYDVLKDYHFPLAGQTQNYKQPEVGVV